MIDPDSGSRLLRDGWWLAVSTSGPDWSVWLGRGATAQPPFDQADLRCLPGVRGQPRDLVGVLSDLLDSRELTTADLAGLVVDSGPGSFTSLRMGLATVRALGWARQLPVAPVSSLDAMAAQALHQGASPRLACVLPARRGWWYVATYLLDDQKTANDLKPFLATRVAAQVADGELASYLTSRLGEQGWTGVGPVEAGSRPQGSTAAWRVDLGPHAAWLAYVAAVTPGWGEAQLACPEYLAVSEAEAAASTTVPDVASQAISQFALTSRP